MNLANAGVVKLVDTIDSKSIERKLVSVQVRSPVNITLLYNDLRCTIVHLSCFMEDWHLCLIVVRSPRDMSSQPDLRKHKTKYILPHSRRIPMLLAFWSQIQ